MFHCNPSIYYFPLNSCILLLILTVIIISCFFFINKIIWKSYNKYFCKYNDMEMVIIPCKKNFYSSFFLYVINSIIAIHLISIILVTYNTVCASESDAAPYWRKKALVFLIEYVICLVLCLGKKVFNERIKLTFILPSNLYECNYVCIWIKDKNNLTSSKSNFKTLGQSFISLYKRIVSYINNNIKGFNSFYCQVFIDDNSGIRYFIAGSTRYVFSNERNTFLPQIQSNTIAINELIKIVDSGGQCDSSVISYLSIFGKNEYPINIESPFSIFKKCFYSSTFIIQYLMLSTTFFLRFHTWSICWSFLILYTNINSFIKECIKNNKIKNEVNLVNNKIIRVKRQNEIKTIKSSDIILYDIIYLKKDDIIPCDTILIDGNVLVDESNLTGESTPIFKKTLNLNLHKGESFLINDKNLKDNILYSGSKILKVYKNHDQSPFIVSIALNTGLFTFKSKIINGVLQQEKDFEEFHNDIPLLWLITMLISIVIIIIQCFISSLNIGSLFFVLGTFMQLLPIWAPAFVQSCINTSMDRLKKNFQIESSSPKRIFFASKLNTLFFDKTGTLTESEYSLNKVEKLNENILQNNQIDILKIAISSCHSLSIDPDNHNNFYGDLIEKEMLKYTNSHIIEEKNHNNKNFKRFIINKDNFLINHKNNDFKEIINKGIEVIKIFDFNGINKSMSVIVQCKITKKVFLFTKGASESIIKYSNQSQIPQDLNSKISKYSSCGYYVLLMAFKELKSDQNSINEYINSKEQDRLKYENQLIPICILCFSNNIKNEAYSVIKNIKELGIQPIILTGDNSDCAFNVAKKVGIIQDYNDEKLILCKDHLSINFLKNQKIVFSQVINGDLIFTYENKEKISIENLIKDLENTKLILTYESFELMNNLYINSINLESEIINNKYFNNNIINNLDEITIQDLLIKNISIISRSNHINKLDVIKKFMNRGNIVGMVGDGSNDIAAMKQSNIGIFANKSNNISSHFILNNGDLKGVINIIFEGCGSAASSRSLYLFMIMYGFTIVVCKNILLYTGQATIPVMGYFYYSILVNFPSVWGLKRCKPAKKMKSYPVDSGLVSRTSILTIISFIFIIGINLSILIFNLSRKSWFISNYIRNLSIPIYLFARQDGFESATTLIWMCSLHSHMALIFGFGGDHREPFYKNLWLVISWLLAQSGLIFILFSEPSIITCLFRVNCIESLTPANIYHVTIPKFVGNNVFPFSWKIELFSWTVLSLFLSILFYLRINRRRIYKSKGVI